MEFLSWVRDQWDRVGAVVLVVAGALALLLGWLGLSDAVLPSEQLPYLLSGGLLGVFLLGLGTTLWLSADLRDDCRLTCATSGASSTASSSWCAASPPRQKKRRRRLWSTPPFPSTARRRRPTAAATVARPRRRRWPRADDDAPGADRRRTVASR